MSLAGYVIDHKC